MSENDPFRDLIRRVRAGDEDAASELVQQYEPEIRREVRVRLTDGRMRQVLDSVDICQSVLAAFFVRAALGQFDLQEPRQLLRLLVAMARNKVIYWARKQNTQRRDVRRQQTLDWARLNEYEPVDTGPSPCETVATAELLELFRDRLSDDERMIADRRAAGDDWAQIAANFDAKPDALRKRFARSLDRIASELGLEQFA